MTRKVDTSIADTIVAQLGGVRAITLCTGAKHLIAAERGLVVHLPRTPKGVQVIEITLQANDTYMVTCSSKFRGDLKEKSVTSDVYADKLFDVLEADTGLLLNVCRIRVRGLALKQHKEEVE